MFYAQNEKCWLLQTFLADRIPNKARHLFGNGKEEKKKKLKVGSLKLMLKVLRFSLHYQKRKHWFWNNRSRSTGI